ncbi:iron-containing alcohol dehydrogenase [Promicromonospora thailandica]|uniref:Alcohol dehydrogenase, class IV n=1 Tax=Promicromonospora thailandica TaxID=765201 RepID=A0A9X2G791_9MICO|nr:iron-containing alcohol dehydrogenase [Promicromonospora thailandica]MCP2264534.1 Alcohol dehydrogenase, class IV [Promicromonospora thailandica]
MGRQVRVHEVYAGRVVQGAGALALVPDELDRLGARRVLVVAAPSSAAAARELTQALGERHAATFGRPVQHTPVEVTARALEAAREARADALVAIGGGSAIGLAKALAIRTGMPQVAVPTTYAGSEATPVLGETEHGVKTTRRDPALAPGTVVYDPELTLSMPHGLTLTSALNALAHAVEALWDEQASAATRAYAVEAADGVLTALPLVLDDLSDVGARARLQEAAWLAGACLAQARMGLHHQLAHALGGTYGLPHAELHALLLAHVLRYDLPAAPDAAARLTRVAGGDPVAAVAALAARHAGPTTLGALGLPRTALREVAERVAAAPYPNPRPVVADEVEELLLGAW